MNENTMGLLAETRLHGLQELAALSGSAYHAVLDRDFAERGLTCGIVANFPVLLTAYETAINMLEVHKATVEAMQDIVTGVTSERNEVRDGLRQSQLIIGLMLKHNQGAAPCSQCVNYDACVHKCLEPLCNGARYVEGQPYFSRFVHTGEGV